MAGVEAGVAYVDLVPRLAPGATAAVEAQSARLGERMGKRFTSVGRGFTTAITAPVVAIGAAAVGSFMAVDDGLDRIRTRTGATGPALDRLEASFDRVGKRVPNSLGEVGDAVGMLAQRTNLTGPRLERMATQVLNLSRITGQDLGQTITGATRLFGDWSVATGQQSNKLDFLFRVSQRTGAPITALTNDLVRFGAPLRQLGFDLDTSAALLGSFEREGVNAQLVMGSMRIALGKMAREGEPAQATLRRVTDEIKSAGSTSEANAIALELFGARAGPDMAAAIREGRFELGGLLGELRDSPESINRAARATDDLPERFGRLRNRITLALAPLGGILVGIAERAVPYVERLVDFVGNLARRFNELPGPARMVIGIIAGIAAAIGPVLMAIGAVLPALSAGFTAVAAVIGGISLPVVAVVAGIAALVAGIVIAYQRSEAFRSAVQRVFDWLRTNVPPIIEELIARVRDLARWIGGAFGDAVAYVRERWGAIKEAVTNVVGAIRRVVEPILAAMALLWRAFGDDVLDAITDTFAVVKRIIEGAVRVVSGLIDVVLGILTGDWSRAWEGAKRVVSGALAIVTALIRGAWERIKSVLALAGSLIIELFRSPWNAAKRVVSGAWQAITGAVRGGWQRLRNLLGSIPGAVRNVAGRMFTAIKDKARDAIDGAVSFVRSLPGRIRGLLGAVGNAARSVGRTIVNSIANGLSRVAGFAASLFDAVRNAARDAINGLIDLLNRAIPDSLGWGPARIDLPDNPIPRLHSGGIVPGPPGSERLVMLRAGENVSTPVDRRLDRSGAPIEVTIVTPNMRGAAAELSWLTRTGGLG